MRKLKTFWYSYKKSLTEPGYYNHILFSKISFSVKYYLFFFLLLSIANTLFFTSRIQPRVSGVVESSIQDVEDHYPEDLVITLENNQLTVTGQEQPINIPFNQSQREFFNSSGHYDYLATIDSQTETANTKALITLTKNDFIYRSETDVKESIPYESLYTESLTINRDIVQETLNQIKPEVEQTLRILPILFFFVMLISAPTSTFILVLVYSFFTYSLANLLQKRIPYKKALQLNLHIVTFAETASFIHTIAFPDTNMSSMLYPLAYFGTALIVVFNLKKPRIIIIKKPKGTNKRPKNRKS